MGRIGGTHDAGFSLIELVAVVAVLAVLSVSVALTTGRPRDEGQSDAAQFARTFANLQNAAVLKGHATGLDLGVGGGKLWPHLHRISTTMFQPLIPSFWQARSDT
ncbi:prepilin-type N-terminal cleavage/methylation domain-containing protein [Tateyamaria sp. SN3-11]|uniref:prepilin-type N-terminal cleavage/methylation domain-containing protein n=1 Tax=Tateyamaria sp. SN3-11 TaxID=3092147 RepID=UPI0039E9EA4D